MDTNSLSNAITLLRNLPAGSPDADKVMNSLSSPELHALESADDLESLVGNHADAIKQRAAQKKYIRRANVSLLITRTLTKGAAFLTNASAQPIALPAPCFGVQEDASNYTRIFSAFLPQDNSVVTLPVEISADGKTKIFTFTNAAASIVETISIGMANGNPYPNLLRAMSNMKFDILEPKMIISDTARINQFDKVLNVFKGSPFTNTSYDSINPQEYKEDVLSDNTIRIFRKLKIYINPEKTLVPMIVTPTSETPIVNSSFYITLVCEIGVISE